MCFLLISNVKKANKVDFLLFSFIVGGLHISVFCNDKHGQMHLTRMIYGMGFEDASAVLAFDVLPDISNGLY